MTCFFMFLFSLAFDTPSPFLGRVGNLSLSWCLLLREMVEHIYSVASWQHASLHLMFVLHRSWLVGLKELDLFMILYSEP